MMVVLDLWAGDSHCDHIARAICYWTQAVRIAERALIAGYLVNLRNEIAWGDYASFDLTQEQITTLAAS